MAACIDLKARFSDSAMHDQWYMIASWKCICPHESKECLDSGEFDAEERRYTFVDIANYQSVIMDEVLFQ